MSRFGDVETGRALDGRHITKIFIRLHAGGGDLPSAARHGPINVGISARESKLSAACHGRETQAKKQHGSCWLAAVQNMPEIWHVGGETETGGRCVC